MKNRNKKSFDAVQMVREIRDAMYKQATDPHFEQIEFKKIKDKWSQILELQEKLRLDH